MSSIINGYKDLFLNSSTFEKMSYIPVASNLSGICNIARGALTTLAGIFMVISGKDILGLNQAGNGNIRFMGALLIGFGLGYYVRGFVEQLPIIGNIACATFDLMTKERLGDDRPSAA